MGREQEWAPRSLSSLPDVYSRGLTLTGFGMNVMVASQNELGNVSSFSVLYEAADTSSTI